MTSNLIIRKPKNMEYSKIFTLIKEMADFEKLSSQVTLTEEQFISDGTSPSPTFQCFIAEYTQNDSSEIAAYALYYFVYSTFQGKSMYLEDMYVKEQYRGKGIGTRLYKAVGKEAVDTGCCRLDFIALNWNEKAIQFHKSMGAQDLTQNEHWHLFRIDKDSLLKMAL